MQHGVGDAGGLFGQAVTLRPVDLCQEVSVELAEILLGEFPEIGGARTRVDGVQDDGPGADRIRGGRGRYLVIVGDDASDTGSAVVTTVEGGSQGKGR